jgi:hypothetical protein
MQKPPRDRLTQAQLAAFSEFNHAPNGLAPVFPGKAVVPRKTRQRSVEDFLHRTVETTGQLLLDDLLLLWFEYDRHNVNPTSYTGDIMTHKSRNLLKKPWFQFLKRNIAIIIPDFGRSEPKTTQKGLKREQ